MQRSTGASLASNRVDDRKKSAGGLHGRFETGGGSFDSVSGAGEIGYSSGKNHFEASGQGFHSGRYLDPPVLDNFTNAGNGNGFPLRMSGIFQNVTA